METYLRGRFMPLRLDTNERYHLISSYFEYQTAAVGVKATGFRCLMDVEFPVLLSQLYVYFQL